MMEEDKYFSERNALNAEMAQLMSNLAANTSSIGDWKIMKIYEARMKGAEDTYDFDELTLQRQAVETVFRTLRLNLTNLMVSNLLRKNCLHLLRVANKMILLSMTIQQMLIHSLLEANQCGLTLNYVHV